MSRSAPQKIEIMDTAYRHASQLDPRGSLARNNLAELLASRGELEAALEVAQEAYRIAEDSPYVLDTLGGLYLRKGLPERAIYFLEAASAARPEWAETRLRLAQAYRDAGRTHEARRALSELRSRDGTPAEISANADAALRSLP